ncbi:MAG: acyltransferase [candidate division Zixibacteria bacterium]|nr:acyltransferase [Candidatus Tariuqbacter arcticus]
MSRTIKCGLIQAANAAQPDDDIDTIKRKNIENHLRMIETASEGEVQILCLQELFYAPYFPAGQDKKWYDMAEPVPQGLTVQLMMETAREYGMVIIAPVMEEAVAGIFYNTAAVIDADGIFLGKYRKHHLPHLYPGFWEHFYFRPGNGGYPVFKTAFADLGVYICYDRHFPEGARILGLNGAEIVFNPSATVKGLAIHLWELEMPANAVANNYFVGAINRVGIEQPWKTGEFFGASYFCDPRGKIIAQAGSDRSELLTAEIDLDLIKEVRAEWQFFRDRRPDSYKPIAEDLP